MQKFSQNTLRTDRQTTDGRNTVA